jgi:hypothetical protein
MKPTGRLLKSEFKVRKNAYFKFALERGWKQGIRGRCAIRKISGKDAADNHPIC